MHCVLKNPNANTWSTSLRTAISSATAHPNSWKDLRRWIQSRCCTLRFTDRWCTITWHRRLPALLWIVPSQRGRRDMTAVAGSAGAIFGQREQLWPLSHHHRSGAPGKRKRGGRKGCEGCCKQSAFTAAAPATVPVSDVIFHTFIFCVILICYTKTTGSQRFYPSLRRETYYSEGLAYEY